MMEPIKIAVPIHSFEPGGVERVALNLCHAWTDSGDVVKVVLGRRDGAMAQVAPGLDYVVRKSIIPTASFETLWMIWCLWRFLRREAVDLLFCPGNSYSVVAVAMKLLLGRRCPPVVAKISNDLARLDMIPPVRWGYRRWLRLQGRIIERFTGMVEEMRDEIANATGVAAARITIIKDPALTAEQFAVLSAIGRDASEPEVSRYLAVGRLAPQKNFALLIRAFAAAAPSYSELVILGEGPERPALEALAAKFGVADRVSLPGHCNDTAAWYQNSSAFVMSSDYEGVPAVIIEALAAGLPVVATACSVGMPGLLGHGAFGLLVPARDEIGFGKALERIHGFPFDAAVARSAANAFTLAQAAPRYRSLFVETAAPRGH